jgi:hypothetical protein
MRPTSPLQRVPVPTLTIALLALAAGPALAGGNAGGDRTPKPTPNETSLRAELSQRLESARAGAAFELSEISRLARDQRAALGVRASTATPLGDHASFDAWLAAVVAYMEARTIVIEDQARELGHVQFPELERGEVARSEIFECAGDGYVLDQSSMFGPVEDDGSCVLALTNGGGAAALAGLERLPFSVPGLDLNSLPDWVAAAFAPYNAPVLDGYFYSAVLGDGLEHSGTAYDWSAAGQEFLIFYPDTVVHAGSWVNADAVAILRYLDQGSDGVDWTEVLHLLRPPLELPTWTPVPGSDGAARVQGSCNSVEQCLLAAALAYDAAVAEAGRAYGEWVDQAQLDYEQDRKVTSESRWGMAKTLSGSLFMGTVGGAGTGAWYDYYKWFDQQNKAQLDKELADAKKKLKDDLCKAARDLRDAVLDCIEDCPEWAWLADYMNSWVASQGC